MTDPRVELFLRACGGLATLAAVIWWLWRCGRVRAGRWFGTGSGDVPAMAMVTWGCAIVTLAAMLLGSIGMLSPLVWVGVTLAGGFLLSGWRVPKAALPADDDRGGSTPPPTVVFVIAVFALVLGRVIFGLRNPPTDVDSMLYHMPMVAHWVATSGLGAARFEPLQIGNFYPGNLEVLALGFAWAAGRETLMTVPGVLGLGLLAFALRGLAIEAGARRAIAEVLAVAAACAPGVLQLTLGLRVDNAFAAWFSVALLFALRARRTGSRGDLEVALCALGLLAGCKSTGPVLAVFVLAVPFSGRGARERLATAWTCRFGLATLCLAGGFWMLRNIVASGNPVYPAPLTLGAWALPGSHVFTDLSLTSQAARWHAGLPGHLTFANLWRFFGPVGALILAAAMGGAIVPRGPRRAGDRPDVRGVFVAVAVATALLTLFQPFSGAIPPDVPGGPFTFSSDNVRYLLPTLVVLVPLAALGLSGWPLLPVALVAAILVLPALLPRAGHLLPALALVVLVSLAWPFRPRGGRRQWASGLALAVLACVAVAAAVTMVDPLRERMEDMAYDATLRQFEGVPASLARELRQRSSGRPIAVSGLISVWALYGRELNGRPEYVPVGCSLAESRRAWGTAPDPRQHANPRLWMRNLRESGASFVVLATGELLQPIERSWCEDDPEEFEPVYLTAQRAVYRVLPSSPEPLTASR